MDLAARAAALAPEWCPISSAKRKGGVGGVATMALLGVRMNVVKRRRQGHMLA